MSEFKFNCPHCGQHLAATEEIIGRQIQCPACHLSLAIPAPARTPGQPGKPAAAGGLHLSGPGEEGTAPPQIAPASASPPNLARCRQCGKLVPTGSVFCASCGSPVMGTHAQSEKSSGLPPNVAAGLCYVGGVVIPAFVMAVRFSANPGVWHGQGSAAFTQMAFGWTQLLSAIGPWVGGLIFLIIDKRSLVRFHAAQSIAWFIGVLVLNGVIGGLIGLAVSFSSPPTGGIPDAMHSLSVMKVGLWGLSFLQLVIFILTFIAMISAFAGKKYYLPGVGDMVQGWVGRNGRDQ